METIEADTEKGLIMTIPESWLIARKQQHFQIIGLDESEVDKICRNGKKLSEDSYFPVNARLRLRAGNINLLNLIYKYNVANNTNFI